MRALDASLAERVAAEAYAAGAVGLEERDASALRDPGVSDRSGEISLLLYAPAAAAEAVRAAAAAAVGRSAAVGAAEPVDPVDWSEAWKRHVAPTVVSDRLVVRPSFVELPAVRGRAELVVDPGQAFGTGSHASTRLALEWIDQLAPGLLPGARVLDVGTGTGVLALAAVRLAADATAIACDLDPLATHAARAAASANGLSARVRVFTGTLSAVAPGAFDLVVANLLRRELVPLLGELAHRVAPGGRAVLSGLLASERDGVVETLAATGLRAVAERSRRDADGDPWVALLAMP